MTSLPNNHSDDILDILGAIEIPQANNIKKTPTTKIPNIIVQEKSPVSQEEVINESQKIKGLEKEQENQIQNVKKPVIKEISEPKYISKPYNMKKIVGLSLFTTKYILTSVFIFGVLLLTTNYSAYINIAQSYIFEDEITQKSVSLLNSVNAGKLEILEPTEKKENLKRTEIISKQEKNVSLVNNKFSMHGIASEIKKETIDLGIIINPYENRIVIPKIGQNIPLVDIKKKKVEGQSELNNIFMKELEGGVVRYPGSASPGEKGNSFIFGHSSNFPWIAGDYNDVFSRLGQVEVGDSVFSYYNQKKYKFIIKEKKVISPNDVSILKRDNNKKEITLMTCWPIGTTLNRLILIGELTEE